jgi:sigma-E factor negative regulatory protein RseC
MILSTHGIWRDPFIQDFSRPDMVKFKIVEEVGVITSTDSMSATVSVPRKSACDGCSLKTCKSQDQFMVIEALNPLDAHVGQRVRVVMKPYSYLKGSMLIYGIPALALILGAVLGKELVSAFFIRYDPDLVSAATGFIFFLLSFIFVKLWSGSAEKNADVKPVIEEILEE